MQRLVRPLVYAAGRALVRLLTRLEITGLDRLPPDGALILMNNHINFTDVSLILMMFPREPVGFAKRELLRIPVLGWLIGSIGVIPVLRGEVTAWRSGGPNKCCGTVAC